MTLTPEQAELLKNGSPLPLTVGQTPCILVRQDVFDKLRATSYDDGEWTEEEAALLAAKMFDDLDRPEPIA